VAVTSRQLGQFREQNLVVLFHKGRWSYGIAFMCLTPS